MDTQVILGALGLGEDKDWEFKSGKGGLPKSLWESYSAMANTDGGVIVLGIKERNDGHFEVQGLNAPDTALKELWDLLNNRGKVSLNLLSNDQVHVEQVHGKSVLVIEVPRASRRQRPVYVGQNPLDGTYRRFNEGDFKCTPDEVGRMLADQSEQPADSVILPRFGMDDLHKKSLEQYRNRFASRYPDHPWLSQNDRSLLEKLGGWRTDRASGETGLTVAGLLMFGKYEAIRDPNAIPQYHLDYRERLSDAPEVRWTDRITLDGTWAGNLFQFYQRVLNRLLADLRVPFQMGKDLFRKDETVVHQAIREAFVNALIHADYRGQGGVVIEKYRNRFELSNPGTLLLSIEQLLQGGISECRNKSLQLMFQQIGGGEKAGSGIDKIRQGWASQQWRWPLIQERLRPDRVRLILSMVSLLPEDSITHLRMVLGEDLGSLSGSEVQALVTADVEGSVTNLRLQQFSNDHTSDITKMLQSLCSKGHLVKDGYGRWASYRLTERLKRSLHSAEAPHTALASSSHNEPDSSHNGPGSSHSTVSEPALLERARPAREKGRLTPQEMERVILDLCSVRALTQAEIGTLLDREPRGVRSRYLSKLVREGRLRLRYPMQPSHPNQAYLARVDENAS